MSGCGAIAARHHRKAAGPALQLLLRRAVNAWLQRLSAAAGWQHKQRWILQA